MGSAPGETPVVAIDRVAQWFGLTPAEARLAVALAGGQSLRDYAALRAVSLNGVRSQLKNAQSPYVSVQDAAAAYGFWHMSQFAVDYRQLFGERPSDTLKRRLVAA